MKALNQNGYNALLMSSLIALVAIIGVGIFFAFGHKAKQPQNSDCYGRMIMIGDKGTCVRDVQTLANWTAYGIEGTKYTPVTGSFDLATQNTVKLAQSNSRLPTNGMADKATWKALCQLEDAPSKVTTAAKDAGC